MQAPVSANAALSSPRKEKPLWRRFFAQWQVQLMIFPALIFIFIFNYIPMYGVLMAFQDYSLFKGFLAAHGRALSILKCFLTRLIFTGLFEIRLSSVC